MLPGIGVIFDMDGVIMDNNAFHEKAWVKFCQKYGILLTNEELHTYIFGRVAKDTVDYLFRKDHSPQEVEHYLIEKENIYRELYRKEIRLIRGILPFLKELKQKQVPTALATSAPPGNVDFAFNYLPVKSYFNVILDASHILNGKPDPEIYIKAAKMLDLEPRKCFIFEDSKSGIKAALDAGANVIGVATTHSESELQGTVGVIRDFSEMNYDQLISILKNIQK